MFSRFSTRKRVLATSTLLLFLAIASTANYLAFLARSEYVDEIIPYLLLLFVEVYIAIQNLGTWWTILYSNDDPRNSAYYRERDRLRDTGYFDKSIDIFVTTYGEDIGIISETVMGARDMHIPHNTYILDDGHSSDVAKLAAELGVHYIVRDNNAGKKAGNINNALSITDGDFVAIFDADHRPARNFLIETLPFFIDSNVAFVQTPQVLRNRENIIAAGSADAQSIFYDTVMFGRNHFNSAFWVGTNAIFRRTALEEVGGVTVHTSEDIMTSYKLHQQGWHSIYIPETLALGFAPSDLSSYFSQQIRWAYGSLYIFFKQNPLFTNLNFDQKIQYFLSSTFYFNGLILLLIMLLPMLFMLTGAKPIDAPTNTWLGSYLPYFILQFATVLFLLGKLSWQAIILSIASFPAYLLALVAIIRNKTPQWKATGAQGHGSKLTYLRPHLILIYICLVSIGIGLLYVREAGTTLLATAWLSINIMVYLIFIFSALRNSPADTKHISAKEYLADHRFNHLAYEL